MAIDAFLKLDKINGESRDKTHEKEIDVLSWSWNMSNTGSAHYGGGAGTGKVQISDVTIVKRVDSASPELIHHCATGEHIASGKLTLRKAAGRNALEYLTIEMKEILVSGVQEGGDNGADVSMETVTLNFGEFKIVYTPQDDTGGAGTPVDFAYDIQSNEVK